MPTDDAILDAALNTMTMLINTSTGMSHPSDKSTVVWTFKILHKNGIALDGPAIRRRLLRAGVPQKHAAEIQEAAERIAGGGSFRNVGPKPLKDDIYERWVKDAGDTAEETSDEEAPSKLLLFTDTRGADTEARATALETALALATRDSTAVTLVITVKNNLHAYADVISEPVLKSLRKNGQVSLSGIRLHLTTVQNYQGRAPAKGPVLIIDCKPTIVESAYYDDPNSTAVIFVPWTPDDAAIIAALESSTELPVERG